MYVHGKCGKTNPQHETCLISEVEVWYMSQETLELLIVL